MTKQILTVIWSLLVVFALPSQTKNEKEERINLEHFPKETISVIQKLPKNCRNLKFYKETDNGHKSYEAKFKYRRKRYSVEFDNTGALEDIEVTVKFKSLEDKSKETIKGYLSKTFKKYKILKVQEQYVWDKSTTPHTTINNILQGRTNLLPNYEIIGEVKDESQRSMREFLFSNAGQLLKMRIVQPSSYEHVLY